MDSFDGPRTFLFIISGQRKLFFVIKRFSDSQSGSDFTDAGHFDGLADPSAGGYLDEYYCSYIFLYFPEHQGVQINARKTQYKNEFLLKC